MPAKRQKKSGTAKKPRDLVHGARPVGRPSRLSRDWIARYVSHVRLGMYPETAAALEGVPREVHLRWLRQGRLDRDAKKRTLHAELCHALLDAAARVQLFDLSSLAVLQRRAEGWDPTCAACEKKKGACGGHRVDLRTAAQIVQWRMQHRFPELWNAQRVRVDGTPDDLEAGDADRGAGKLVMYVPSEDPEG